MLNDIETPVGLDVPEAERILNQSARALTTANRKHDLRNRLEYISGDLLGRSYVDGSLGGGPDSKEEFRIYLSAFDCVTFMETVLALALSYTSYEFVDVLRRIRYEQGKIDWFHRNHYMIDWAASNERGGFIRNQTFGPLTVEKKCTLGLIAGLPEKTITFPCFPTPAAERVFQLVETGDLMLFVSTKDSLDVFHTGIIAIGRDRHPLLRHATRTGGAAIEQDLSEFVSQNEMAGFIILRPVCQM